MSPTAIKPRNAFPWEGKACLARMTETSSGGRLLFVLVYYESQPDLKRRGCLVKTVWRLDCQAYEGSDRVMRALKGALDSRGAQLAWEKSGLGLKAQERE